MKNKVFKDKHKRNLSLLNENKKHILKSIYKNQKIPVTIRWNSSLEFSNSYLKNNFNSLVSRCILTGRKKTLHRHFKLSRLALLKLIRSGGVYGLTKSSW